MECPICLETFNVQSQILSTPCDHIYHSECINSWLATGSRTCPNCRSRLRLLSLRQIYLQFTAEEYESKILKVQIVHEHFEDVPLPDGFLSPALDVVSSNRATHLTQPSSQRSYFIRRILDYLCLCGCFSW